MPCIARVGAQFYADETGPLFQFDKATDTWSTIEECSCAYRRRHLHSDFVPYSTFGLAYEFYQAFYM
eukprot:scaffold90584_cov30-Prasinocladus_malaysianus.AAC.2